MGFLPPLAWVVIGILISVEGRLLGTWWGRRYACPTARYIQAAGALLIHGTAIFLATRGLALALLPHFHN